MRIFSRLTFVALAAFILGSCQKQVENIGAPDPLPVLPDPVSATVQGNVLDENGTAAAGVTVAVGNRTATTDARGYFRITGASLDKNMSLVTASKAGYFKAYRSFAATSGANQVQIKLLKRALAGTVSAASGGDASLANGSKVTLPAGGIVTASNGATYSGSVSVYAAYIDPTASDIASVIPGSLMANDANGTRTILTSYGMLAVELEGTSGEKLQIKSGQNAVLTTAIPAAAQATAPASIPLWYLDEATGVWKEQGSATKQGDKYVGNVPHFSFWNCDIAAQTVTLQATINGPGGQPLPNVLVRLARPSQYGTHVYSWTDSLGQVRGIVPANEALTLSVIDNCNNVVFTQNVGPFTQNTILPAITATITNSSLSTISGKLLNCSAQPVTNGFAIIQIGNQTRYVSTNASGDFSVQVLNCGGVNTAGVFGVDNAVQVQSAPATYPITAGTTNVGTINVCGVSATQFINYTYDGTPFALTSTNNDSLVMYTSPIQGSTMYQTSVSGMSLLNPNGQIISFGFQGAAATGTYPAYNIYVNGRSGRFNSNLNVTVTNWPAAIGDFMQATFNGTFVDSTATGIVSRPLSGSFKLRKNF
ncbi:MAG: carboxypeptidase regulatory-like domain-containing protein [Chitinophagaceae bacterium]|nr:MAG: carboxypeptidase regulatory-like domain-containing protein [Chitinophagaceae bacterium]